MKDRKINRIAFILGVIVFTLYACSKEDDPAGPLITDISVASSTNSITWIDQDDLTIQLGDAFTFNYGDAKENEVETSITYANDSSEVSATIDFKAAFQSAYFDPNKSNNTATITLIKERDENDATVTLLADGPGDTYDLITSVLAPGYNPIEVPDCGHSAFGDHIDEVWDSTLNTNVFRFIIHVDDDNDRCLNFDRQRNEIKSYDKSPANLLGTENEMVAYKWKFKLPTGFQSSPNFTHLHQLKSVGGPLESMPMYTLTTRKSSPDRIELRYAETDSQVTLAQTDLAPFIDEWIEVTEVIKYGFSGTYDIRIKRIRDDAILFEYSNNAIVNWRSNASFVRPKWGVYRSLLNAQDLRDEIVRYADFSIEEL